MDEVKAPEVEQQAPAPVAEEQAIANTGSNLPAGFWTDPKAIGRLAQVASKLCSSNFVPQAYRGNWVDCMIAMELASRTNFPLMMVMQNLYVIQGKPSWSGQFCTAVVNNSGRFSPLEFVQLTNEDGSTKGYFARATRLSDGTVCEGPPVDWDMVKGEGWLSKSGSKWKTMPELMFRYRAAAFFVRTHCPELLCGLQTMEEVQDVKGYEQPKETTVITLD